MISPKPTPQQQRALTARGNVLVVAGAGAGKTQTVVDRCLAWLLNPDEWGSIDQVLMVTFTQAAAAEMRQRLRHALEAAQVRTPSLHLAEQLALLDTAHISTLHSFCFHLVSRHFHEIGLDPRSRIMPEERARLLERRTMDLVLDAVYAGKAPTDFAIQDLIQVQGGDWDKPVRDLVLRLYHYTQTLRDPAGWFARQRSLFENPEPTVWLCWLMDELSNWRARWLPLLQAQPAENKNVAACARALATLPDRPNRQQFAEALNAIAQADAATWPRPKARWREPVKNIFDEAEFLHSLCAVTATDPLAEDWQWTRRPMLALLDLAGRFGRAFQEAKRQEGGVDFHDVEQFALRLLWENNLPSPVAAAWRAKLRLIFVDEYQDINEAQAAIIEALGGDGAAANRFLVGDVKQSIYGFRLADPRIFSRCHDDWKTGSGAQVIPLTENFRSHEAILHFVNAVFAGLMRRETGGVEYDDDARLRFGNAADRVHLSAKEGAPPPVELHVHWCGGEANEPEQDAPPDFSSDAEKEARLLGRRLLELKRLRGILFDKSGCPRDAQWSDMVILLRSHRAKVETYVKEFARLGIPLSAARGGFYESLEVRDLLGLLQLLDNPLQDLPLLGVLRSPLVGLVADELAVIRLQGEQGRFWVALEQWHRKTKDRGAAFAKVDAFLRGFVRWRARARQSAVSQCLERIIDETNYGDWLATQERGEQRRANVERLLQLTRQFDAYDGESLYRFLKFVEAQQESDVEIEPAVASGADAVRLMSIHQSKGLEFPIVALADLGKKFNTTDSSERVILDEECGLSPQIQPPGSPQFYPSLPYWLAQRRQKLKTLGEEMRLLYVALTRAAQRLVLAGTASRSRLEKKWTPQAEHSPQPAEIMAAQNYLDWLGPWTLRNAGPNALADSGGSPLLSWTIYNDKDPRLAAPPAAVVGETKTSVSDVSPEIRDRLSWRYPFPAETKLPAKASVTTLRRQIAGDDGDESVPLFAGSALRAEPRSANRLTAAEIGLAHHTFLQWASFDSLSTASALQAEAKRLADRNLLTHEESAALNFDGLADFWQSEVGHEILGQGPHLQRELAFTARFSATELRDLGCAEFAEASAKEFVVVQGAIDLAAILPGEIWLLDFKTDHFPAAELDEKIKAYRPQLELYALAISRIYNRPVTKKWLHFLAPRRTVPI